MRRALITGITGQDGSYLTELLLQKGYEVHGIVRRASTFNLERLDTRSKALHLHVGDVTDAGSVTRIMGQMKPDEVYNLAAQSHVKVSFNVPIYTTETIVLGTLNVLEAVRQIVPSARVYQASSSEMFGSSPPPQDETTPFRPQSPYGAAKLAAHWNAVNYRDGYGLHVCCGILFNHESPRRLETFVTRKVTRAVGRIFFGIEKELRLGNLEAERDWGHASDYVNAMWLMLQHDTPDDYVIATGISHSVQELVDRAFLGAFERWDDLVKTDPKYLRPTELTSLRGNASKAHSVLGWEPTFSFEELIDEMVAHDMKLAEGERSR